MLKKTLHDLEGGIDRILPFVVSGGRTGKRKVVSYSRFSSEKQSDSSTIETQQETIRRFCALNNFEIVEEYVDRALSAGEAENRTSFQRMIQDLQNRKIYAVVVYTRDRFSRNMEDFINYISIMEDNDCRLICAIGTTESETPSGKLSEWISMTISDYFLKNLSREVIRGLRWNAQHGLNNGVPPLGYDVDPKTKNMLLMRKRQKLLGYRSNWYYKECH